MTTRRRATVVTAAAAAVACCIVGCTSAGSSGPVATVPASPSASSGGAATGTHWLLAASGITQLEQVASRAVVKRYLDGPQTTVITSDTIPSGLRGWDVNFAVDTRSLAEIRDDVTGGLSARISMILYDPEHWQFTPLSEQTDVGAAARTAASLASGAGRQLIVAPATNLVDATTPDVSAAGAFIQTGDLAKVAPSASWVDIQAQGLERDSQRYSSYVSQAVSQIRSANPSAVIYAGLSTNPSGSAVTAQQLLTDISLTSSEVTGYWLNIPSPGASCPACGEPQPQIGLEVLERMAQ